MVSVHVSALVVCFFRRRLALLAWAGLNMRSSSLGLPCAVMVTLHHVPNIWECFRFEMSCLIPLCHDGGAMKRRELGMIEQSYNPALGRPGQEDCKFEVNLDFEVKPSQRTIQGVGAQMLNGSRV